MDRNQSDILEIVNYIKDNMFTREDAVDMEERFQAHIDDLKLQLGEVHHKLDGVTSDTTYIRSEISAIKRRVTALEDKVKDHSGFAKEIDYLLTHVATLEKRTGLTLRDGS
jgi:archaellum component FlaC